MTKDESKYRNILEIFYNVFSERWEKREEKRPQEETQTYTENSDHLIFSLSGVLTLDVRCPPSPSITPFLMK